MTPYIPHITLGVYLVALLGLGIAGFIRARSQEDDFYLAGRQQGLLTTSMTIMATFFSGVALLKFPGWVYEAGIGPMFLALNLPVAGCAIYLIGNRIRKRAAKHGFVTPAEMIAEHYSGNTTLRLLIALLGFLYVMPYVMIQIKAGGELAESMFAGTESIAFLGRDWKMYDAGTGLLAFITMVYVLVGGMRSVAWTDVLQGMLLLSGMLLGAVMVVHAMGGVSSFFQKISALDGGLLSMNTGAESKWNPWWLMTFCGFASIASILQPAQWMRFCAAKSSRVLRHSALIFSVVLPCCFLFGVMLVGLGGRVLYPPSFGMDGAIIPPETLGSSNQVVMRVLQDTLPELMGTAGSIVVALMMVAVMAASMSTADSNLHALSAVVTRDVYARLNPRSSSKGRAWVGRVVIVVATLSGLAMTWAGGRGSTETGLIQTMGNLFALSMAFACQILPATIDMFYIGRGNSRGVVAGIVAGVVVIFMFSPFMASLIFGIEKGLWGDIRNLIELSALSTTINALVFWLVTVAQNRKAAAHG